uniref:GATA zinc finger domain-containing protein 1 n=1 Tax=Romanomermis culicivorax TaxID=13658 RepID=A0A915HMY4_ROMCU
MEPCCSNDNGFKSPALKRHANHSRSSAKYGVNNGNRTTITTISNIASLTKSKGKKSARKQSFPQRSTCREVVETKTVTSLWHNGSILKLDDIIRAMDETDNLYYYAQIRGLVRDGFCNRFAALTWLLPKRPFAPYESSTRFDRSHFVLGPEDETLYDLNALEYVSSYNGSEKA